MGNSILSWNINLQNTPNKSAFYAHLLRLSPPWVLGMNGLKEAFELSKVLTTTNVIHRWKSQEGLDNDDTPTNSTPKDWVNKRISQLRDDGIPLNALWLYTNNESGDGDAVLQWIVDVIKYAVPLGLRLVVGNFSVGTPSGDPIAQWSRPLMLELLNLLSIYPNQLVLGLHEYFPAIVTGGFVGGLPTELRDSSGNVLHPDYTKQGNWPNQSDAKDMTMWFCGRFKFINKVCEINNIPLPRIVMTEFGADSISVSGYDQWRKSLPKPAEFSEIRGIFSLQNVYKMWFPNLSFYDSIMLNFAYAQEVVYGSFPNVEALLLFQYTDSYEWNSQGFGWSSRFDFLSYLEDYSRTGFVAGKTWTTIEDAPNVVNDPDITIHDGVRKRFNQIDMPSNVRSGADIGYPIVETLKDGNSVVCYPELIRWDSKSRYEWVFIVKESTGVVGWVALIRPFEEMFVDEKPNTDNCVEYVPIKVPYPLTKESGLNFLIDIIHWLEGEIQ